MTESNLTEELASAVEDCLKAEAVFLRSIMLYSRLWVRGGSAMVHS